MLNDATEKRIVEVSDGVFGLLSVLMSVRSTVGDTHLNTFLDKVPERGEALWLRFRSFQKASKIEVSFGHFIASVVMPNPLRQ